ncbi:hypothetical protein [Paenibacillus amylolyticus]|mgnify:CR=1 FL=1|uniref:hypothetical protein n=2 Tax=Paenibacillus TaxID=44249 RepID=UPI0013E32049|nr:hypothetical protein [Paenibacillus amylolyticus]WFA82996.1 hypothetical protein OGI70_18365 [Paenibacillus amylolyticus]
MPEKEASEQRISVFLQSKKLGASSSHPAFSVINYREREGMGDMSDDVADKEAYKLGNGVC